MDGDIFGNLMDWGHVLDKIEGLAKKKHLDEYQAGLTRILKYRDNWRLREAVLECVGQVEKPCSDLIREVMNIMADEGTYYDMRILATNALGELICKCSADQEADSNRARCTELMRAFLESPQPPIFHEALENSLRSITTRY